MKKKKGISQNIKMVKEEKRIGYTLLNHTATCLRTYNFWTNGPIFKFLVPFDSAEDPLQIIKKDKFSKKYLEGYSSATKCPIPRREKGAAG
jgi:hypothetical protein